MTKKSDCFKLNNGFKIPALGLGTFNNLGPEAENAVKAASKTGYRLFDTSPAYGNESVLKCLWQRFFGIERSKYIIETKLFLNSCVDNKEYSGLKESLKNLNIKYIDIYLLHWAHPKLFIKNYKEMEKFYKDGLVKTIGVCNMEIHHLEQLMNECDIVPAINQIEVTPMLTQKPLIEFCKNHGILTMAYTPFARMHEKLFNNSALIELANKYNKKPTQIILRWNIQQGRCVIPKSSNKERIKENFDIFDFVLSKEDLDLIDSINEDFRVRFHPDVYPLQWGQENGIQ